MRHRSLFILAFGMSLTPLAWAGKAEISGQVTMPEKLQKTLSPKGALFIFAKRVGQQGMPPVAVLKVDNPHFPLKFSLSEKNVMLTGTEFHGPLLVTARYSPSGDALDRSGPQGEDEKNPRVEVGQSNLNIELKLNH